jgi:hypothetical protein
MFATTVTTGSTSAGNSTFLMRFPPAMRTPVDSATEDWNHVQGRIPQKRKRKYGSMLFARTPGSM